MNKFLLFLSIFSISLLAQPIPNAGFENWTNGNPVNWTTDNIPPSPPFFPGAIVVTQSADKYSGSSAVKLEIIDLAGDPYYPTMNSFFPATQRYGSLTGYYKFAPQTNAHILKITVWLFNGTLTQAVGLGDLETNVAVSAFSQFTVPIEFFPTIEQPDSAWITILVDDSSDNPTVGAYAIIDDLTWGPVVGVNDAPSNLPGKFEMVQNYPNPFNPSTMIEYTLPEESFVQLKVYDIVGNELTTLINEYQPAGRFRAEFNAANLSSGIYLAKLTAGSFTKTMKMTLLK